METCYDSDDDVYSHKFQLKEKVDFCYDSNWYTGTVENVTDEMIQCYPEVQPTQGRRICPWIDVESDDLAPPHTATVNEKRKLHQYYVTMLRNNLKQGP